MRRHYTGPSRLRRNVAQAKTASASVPIPMMTSLVSVKSGDPKNVNTNVATANSPSPPMPVPTAASRKSPCAPFVLTPCPAAPFVLTPCPPLPSGEGERMASFVSHVSVAQREILFASRGSCGDIRGILGLKFRRQRFARLHCGLLLSQRTDRHRARGRCARPPRNPPKEGARDSPLVPPLRNGEGDRG